MRIIQKVKFGSTDKDINELAQKVLNGEKIATCSLFDYYKAGIKKFSKEGDYMAVLNSSDKEVAIVKVTKIEIVRFGSISESFAIEEGDGSLANWKAIHYPYYTKLLSAIDKELTDDTELICEWFQLVSNANEII